MPYLNEEAVLLRIFTRESRLYSKMERLASLGFEGFTVLQAIGGYGLSGPASVDIEVEALDLPVVIEIFTTYGKFKEKQEELIGLVPGLVTIERATMV